MTLNISGLTPGIEAASSLDAELSKLDLAGRLKLVASLGGRAVFTTSLGIEDQVITAAIGTHCPEIEVATLETGMLFKETLDLIGETEERYSIDIQRFYPTTRMWTPISRSMANTASTRASKPATPVAAYAS